jgi:hypothetical protein
LPIPLAFKISETLRVSQEAAMFGYGLLGTVLFIALVVWLVRAL